MKNHTTIFVIVIFILAIIIVAIKQKNDTRQLNAALSQNIPIESSQSSIENKPSLVNNNNQLLPPLENARERVTKKYFGIFITSKNSPVQPERFHGYHTGSDFEIFPNEVDSEVVVHAICKGKLILKKYASGYGGVAIQSCQINNENVTVIYGHLKLESINQQPGDDLDAAQTIGILGKGYSSETDGERKHLHLGIHKGNIINIMGYVQNKNVLSQWIDPCLYVCD